MKGKIRNAPECRMSHQKIKNVFKWEKRPHFHVNTLKIIIFSYIWHTTSHTEHKQLTHGRRIKTGKMYFHFMGSSMTVCSVFIQTVLDVVTPDIAVCVAEQIILKELLTMDLLMVFIPGLLRKTKGALKLDPLAPYRAEAQLFPLPSPTLICTRDTTIRLARDLTCNSVWFPYAFVCKEEKKVFVPKLFLYLDRLLSNINWPNTGTQFYVKNQQGGKEKQTGI